MQVEKQKRIPENLKKKQERDAKDAEDQKKQQTEQTQNAEKNAQYYAEAGKKHYEAFQQSAKSIVDKKRAAKANNEIFVEEEPKFLLVVRIKGINKVAPKEKKIMQLLRLRQINNAVLLKNNKAVMNMVRRIEAYVTYGYPTHQTVRALIYKRGYGKINRQRIPLSNNAVVEAGLGEFGIKCVEDLINEIWTFGEHFKEANNFLWPFKLNSPRGGLVSKRHQWMDNRGDQGPRDVHINELIRNML
mgnify:CR=1 FL=1